MTGAVALEQPASYQAVAKLLTSGRRVQPVGGATKLHWGGAGRPAELTLSTAGLDAIVEHNVGDLTAVLQGGIPLSRAQEQFAAEGQRLCLDPPDGDGRATIGGIVATGDSGPLRHRYGAVRDLILGVRVALPDGTVARAGSNVIKNVAGYDLAKLMCGALGTLGVVCEVTVRLHPRPQTSVTAVGRGPDPAVLAAAAAAVGRRPLELDCLDIRWDGRRDGGAVLARAAGHTADQAAATAARLMTEAGLESECMTDDEAIWSEQRERQRAPTGAAVARVSALPSALPEVLGAVPAAVGRAALGLAWVRLDADAMALEDLRAQLSPAACVLLDAPATMRAAVDPWGVPPGPELNLARRVKQRFDPSGLCNAGRFVGGL